MNPSNNIFMGSRIALTVIALALSLILSAKTYYVAPTGGSDAYPGTISQPWTTWQKAFDMAKPGDTVYFRGGTYYSTGKDVYPRIDPYGYIPHGASGTHENPICYFAYPDDWARGNYPILDCSGHTAEGSLIHGIVINRVQYINFKGLTIRNLYQRGITKLPCAITIDYSANLTFENMVIHDISGRGVWWNEIVGYYDKDITPSIIHSDTTRWINCDFYNLCDSTSLNPGNAADCIKGTLNGRTSTDYPLAYIYLNGCRFWNYSDDGTDIGGGGIVVHENCWASSTSKYATLGIEGNGFKSGIGNLSLFPQDSTLLIHWRRFSNCIAANCEGEGFYDLDYAPYLRNRSLFYNNTAYNNLVGFSAKNNVIYKPRNSTYKNNIVYKNRKYENSTFVEVEIGSNGAATYPESHNTWDAHNPSPGSWPFLRIADTTFTNGVAHTISVTNEDFISLDANELFLPRKSDGSLPDINFLKLTGTSDLIDAGTNVGLPYYGSAPDLGYSEYRSGTAIVSNPIYLFSSIENATPSRLEMTYNLSLANTVPATSAFVVKVNNVTRTVSSVSISGTKILLTLANPVVFGEVVTVAYNKPASNPIQTISGGQAVSITVQNVTNNVATVIPVHVTSGIENATPSMLEMTYNLSLANIVPAASAFVVKVNNVTRTVSSVSISGTKVLLTLASPVIFGDIVTVAYNKPATNPIQTTSGGQAVSITAQNATNNVSPVIPVYVNSGIENATPSRLEMTYNLSLANIVPAASAFVVNVNNVNRTVSSVSIAGIKVLLTLSSPVIFGDVVTVAYNRPTSNPIQTPNGGAAVSIIKQNVQNNIIEPINQSPFVSISSPTKSSSFIAPATVTIDAVASDSDGHIIKVVFYQGTTRLGEVVVQPYEYTWKNVVAGTYTITAVAIDDKNSTSTSTPVTVVVEKSGTAINQLPAIAITIISGKNPKKHDDIVIIAEASDPDGTVSKVEFKSNNVSLAEITSAPFVYTLTNLDTGTYAITAIATDNLGATSVSLTVELKVEDLNRINPEILNLYPNPNDGHFTVDIPNNISNEENIISIYNLEGQNLLNVLLGETETKKEFDIPEFLPGIYIIMLTNKGYIVATNKFIKR